MSGESRSHHIVGTRPFRYRLQNQIRMSCRLYENHENLTNTIDDRTMRAELTYHEPPEEINMLSYLSLVAALLQSQRNDRTSWALTSGSGMLFRRFIFSVSKNVRPSSTRCSAVANYSSRLSAHLQFGFVFPLP